MKVKRAEASGLKRWSMVGRHAGLLSVIVLSGSLCASIAQTESAELKDSQHEDRQHKKVREEVGIPQLIRRTPPGVPPSATPRRLTISMYGSRSRPSNWPAARNSTRPLSPRRSYGRWRSSWPACGLQPRLPGVSAYAHSHTGEAAAAAYLALGHAYLLDHKYPDAVSAFHSADLAGKSLEDYADYLTAQAFLQDNKLADAETVLNTFIRSILTRSLCAACRCLRPTSFCRRAILRRRCGSLTLTAVRRSRTRRTFSLRSPRPTCWRAGRLNRSRSSVTST